MAKQSASKTVPMPVAGSLVHFELYTDQPPKTQKFYEDVFGWKFVKTTGMDYTLVNLPAAPNGGMMKRTTETQAVPGFLSYIQVDSVDDATKKIKKAGGKILMPKYEVAKVGWFALFEAPGGIVQAVWEQNPEFTPE